MCEENQECDADKNLPELSATCVVWELPGVNELLFWLPLLNGWRKIVTCVPVLVNESALFSVVGEVLWDGSTSTFWCDGGGTNGTWFCCVGMLLFHDDDWYAGCCPLTSRLVSPDNGCSG